MAWARFELRALAALTLLSVLPLGACASTGAPASDEFSRELRERGFQSSDVVVPFAISPEMAAWVRSRVSRDEPIEARLDRLFLAVMTELDLRYEAGHTATAPGVFLEKRANCLGFTSLFVGLAREVGIPAFYLAVEDVERFQRDGDLVVVSSHVSAAFDTGAGFKVLDFTLAPVARAREARRLDDVAATAVHYSNVGAEKLRAGDVSGALAEFRVAVALDPTLAGARTNLGVALRRTGDLAGAEAAYRAALESDPDALSAYQNLAALLRLLGREQESIELLHLAERKGTKNPYSFLSLGDLSMRFARLDEAKRFYRRALRLYRKDAEPYAAMGLWALASGDRRAAARWLQRAKSIDAANQRVQRLAAKLG
jgi:Flp pilus assembly protein TadD